MKKVVHVDIVADLSWGDTGKGKVVSHLCKIERYEYVCRWGGGQNAGHTVYIDGEKFKTHLVPSGVFHEKISVIGPNCVLNVDKFFEELAYLEDIGIDLSLIKISPKAHIVTNEHLSNEKNNFYNSLGTTRTGIAPCYAAKAARTGVRAEDVKALRSAYGQDFIWDEKLKGRILCEGAQGFYLDINYGNYPYVTSSETLPYSACSLGFPMQKVRKIYGTAKMYDTRSGVDPLFPKDLDKDRDLNRLASLGKEFGTTTGRKRSCNWLNLDKLIYATRITGATDIIINKEDVVRKLKRFKLIKNGQIKEFENIRTMKAEIANSLSELEFVNSVKFSGNPETI